MRLKPNQFRCMVCQEIRARGVYVRTKDPEYLAVKVCKKAICAKLAKSERYFSPMIWEIVEDLREWVGDADLQGQIWALEDGEALAKFSRGIRCKPRDFDLAVERLHAELSQQLIKK